MKKAIIALSTFITLAACHANYDKAPSGLIYKIFPGNGGAKLATAKFVKLNIEYALTKNGKDSILQTTFGKFPQFSPIDTTPARVAYSYMEIVPKCSVGDSVEFTISIDTLRGRNVNLPANIFPKGEFIKGKMKILNAYNTREEIMADVKKEQDLDISRQAKVMEDYLAKNNIKAQKTKNGAYVLVEQPGTDPKADSGKQVFVKYRGYLLDGGTVFDTNMDSSKGHIDPYPVVIGEHHVVAGWEECLPYFGKGGKGKMFIPAGLGYGPQGNGPAIPPNASLGFDVEITDVKDAPPAQQNPMMGMPQQQRPATATPVKPTLKPATKPAH